MREASSPTLCSKCLVQGEQPQAPHLAQGTGEEPGKGSPTSASAALLFLLALRVWPFLGALRVRPFLLAPRVWPFLGALHPRPFLLAPRVWPFLGALRVWPFLLALRVWPFPFEP